MISTDIREQLKSAMREKDQVKLDTLRAILAGFTSELVASGKTPQDEVTDDIALKVVQKLIKQRKDAISQFEAGGRADLATDERAQLAVLEQFQPPQMPEEEIRTVALRLQAELGLTDKAKAGMLMGAVKKEIGSAADGATIKSVIDSLFA